MILTDPRTFNANDVNDNKVVNAIKTYNNQLKEDFLNLYADLSLAEKFYTLTVIVLGDSTSEQLKNILLPELENELRILKVLNKPSYDNLTKEYEKLKSELPKGYRWFYLSNRFSDIISKYENLIHNAN